MNTSFMHKSILIRWFSLCSLFCLLWLPGNLQASHIVGGDIRYNCLGNNQYEIVLEVYRDCFFGDPLAWFDNPASVGVFNKAGLLVTEVKMNLIQNDTLESNLGDPCLIFPGDVCVHRGLYKKVVTLPFTPDGYTLTYQRCCRNETIVNIQNPLTSGATYTINLTAKAMTECNSAPFFNELAPLFVCVNKPLVWDHSATDPDGDSLVYILAPPLLGGSFSNAQPVPPAPPPYSPVLWVDPPFNTQNMLGGSVPLTIDPHTGIMTAFPTIQGQFVVGVCVLEYRDGELLSVVHRDFQWNVGVCGEVISSFQAPNAQCDNLAVSFENTSTEATSYEWYFDFPNTTPSSTEENPVHMFPDTGTYTIALIAEPNSLCADTSYHELFLQFNSTAADFEFTLFNCGDSSVVSVKDLSIDTVSAVSSWFWEMIYNNDTITSTEQNPFFLIPSDVEATLQLMATSENGCIGVIAQTFVTDEDFPDLLIADTLTICTGDTISLNPNFAQIDASGYTWSPGNLLNDPSLPNPTTVPLDTTTVFSVEVLAPMDLCVFEQNVTVIVLPEPVLSFDFFVNCDNLTVDFTNTSTGVTSLFWDFGDLGSDSDTSSLENPSYTYPDLGTYTVTLSTGPNATCPGVLVQDIEIAEQLLIADFNYGYETCETTSATVLFTDASTNSLDNTVSWEWTFGNGLGTGSGQSVSLEVFGSQSFDVTLIITTADGCVDSITQEVVVGLLEDIDAVLETDLLICLGQSIPLNPNGNPDYIYEWSPASSLDDPTAVNPVASPDTTTTYHVFISYISGDTCTIEREVTVTVDTILPDLSFDYQIECNGATVVFTNTSQNADDYFWIFGDPTNPGSDTSSQVNPTYTYPGIGSYTVTLTTGASELCNDTLVVDIMLPERELEANFVYGWGICEIDSATVVFVDSSFNSLNNTVQWDWVFSGGLGTATGQTVTLDVENGQTFTATLIITTDENCVDSITQTINVDLIDIDAVLEPYIRICPGDIVALNPNGNPIYDYFWTPATGLITPQDVPNPFASPAVTTTYDVEITYISIDTCTIFRQVTVEVDTILPLVDFEYTVDCDGNTVYFENTSSNATGFVWIFGDPSNPGADTSTLVNPTYVFPDTGTYLVTLMTDGTNFCQDTIVKEIFLDDRTLVPDFSFELLTCDPDSLVVAFTDESINPMNNIVEWQWVFSNGDTSSLQNPVITLFESQSLVVEFTVITDEGCDSTLVDTVLIDFIVIDLEDEVIYCPGGPGVGLNPNGNPNYTYVWSPAAGLDDPTAVNPIASPDTTTTYSVTITYITFDTCVIFDEIIVFVPPVIGLNASGDVETCDAFTDISATITGDASSFFWLNANGDVVGDSLVLTVTVSGVQYYVAYAEDQYGCFETDTVYVQGGPVDIEMSPDQVICLGDNLSVFVTNLDPNDVLTYQWAPSPIIVGGETTSNPIIDQIPGEYWLSVTATNQFGCVAVDSVHIVIIDTDIALDFDFIILCDGLMVEFLNQSTNAFGFLWTFGDPALGTSTEVNPTFVFPGVGVYEVTLDLQFDAVCVVPFTATVEIVEPILTADFTFSYAECAIDSLAIQFMDNSYNFQNNTTDWFWTFSNGETSNEQNPIVVVYEGDSLIVTLTITTAIDCEATFTDTIYYHFYDDIVLEDTIVLCIGDSVQLNPNGNPDYDYLWIPSATLDDSSSFNPTAFPTETTDYNVFITFFDGNDTCTIEQTVTVFVPTPLELFTSADTTVCGPDAIIFAVSNVSPVTYIWSDDTGNTNYPDLPAIPVVVDSITSFFVQVIDEYGCTIFDTITVRNGEIDIFTESLIIICPMDSLQLTIQNLDTTDSLDITWTAGPGGVIYTGGNTPTPTVGTIPGSVIFTYEITNQFGCFLSGQVEVIMSDFDPILPDTIRICPDVPTPLNPDGNPDYVYQWSPTTGLDDPTSYNPSATLDMDMTYTVTITDFDGVDTCQEVLQIVVLVNPFIDLETFGDTTLCDPVSTLISASSTQLVDFVWSDNPSFDPVIGTGTEIEVTADGTTIYYVQATDDLGCTEVGTVTILGYPIDISVLPNYDLCLGENLQIQLVNNAEGDQDLVNIQWQPIEAIESGATTQTPTVNPTVSTSFYVTVENQYGCTGEDSTFVTVIDVITTLFATADPDTIVAGSGDFSQLLTFQDPTYIYDWTPSISLDNSMVFNPVASPEETTIYTITVEGLAGCNSSASVTVTVLDLACEEPNIFIPSGFSPNGDGFNDIFYVRGANIDEVHLMVYNRWGEKIFESFDLDFGWDGTYKGERLTPDSYAYYVEALCFGGETFVKKGSITLLR